MESLSKMVKLEQNIDGFEGKAIGIKQTILDAVDTLYEKLEKRKSTLHWNHLRTDYCIIIENGQQKYL